MTLNKITMTALAALLALFLLPGQAAAQTTIVLGADTCDSDDEFDTTTNPILGIWSWDGETKSCTYTSTDYWDIYSDITLDIPTGVTLRLLGGDGPNYGILENSGTIINNGTLILDGGAGFRSGTITNHPGGLLVNSGTIELNGSTGRTSGALVNNANGFGFGTLNNNGVINANGGSDDRSGIVLNGSVINNACGAEIIGEEVRNTGTGTINNAVCSPEALLSLLIDDVEALDLPANPEKQLLKKLNGAVDKLAAGKPAAAVEKMNGFIGQVNAKLAEGIVDQATATALIDQAEVIIDAINAG